jgi:hypothetical protein
MLYIALPYRAFCICNTHTSSIILVNGAPHQSQLGAVNGVGQTVASFVRGAGPAMAGFLWSACLSLPGAHQFVPFAVPGAFVLMAVVNYEFVTINR